MRFMVLTWVNHKIKNSALWKVLLVHTVEFPCLLPRCFAREQQDILTDILREGSCPSQHSSGEQRIVTPTAMSALSKWVETQHGSEYKWAREMPRLKEALEEHLVQPSAQSRTSTEIRPGFPAQPLLKVSPWKPPQPVHKGHFVHSVLGQRFK